MHLSGPAAEQIVPNLKGLVRLQGRLSLGSLNEPDGHVSMIRLLLSEDQSVQLLAQSSQGR